MQFILLARYLGSFGKPQATPEGLQLAGNRSGLLQQGCIADHQIERKKGLFMVLGFWL